MEDTGTTEEITLADLLDEIAQGAEIATEVPPQEDEKKEEETPTMPVFTDSNEQKKEEEEITEEQLYITEEELTELETEMEGLITEYEAEIASKDEQIQKEIENRTKIEKDLEAVEAAWSKVQEVPILGKLVQDVIEGKEVKLPDIISEKVNEDIKAMPQIPDSSTVSIPESPKTLQDVFNTTPTTSFDI